MAKLCRACQYVAANRGGVCDGCRRSILLNFPVPALRPGIWKMAGVFVTLLAIASTLIAAALVTLAPIPWRPRPSSASRLPQLAAAHEVAMVVQQTTRKVYPYSLVPGGAENLDEAKRAMNDPAVKANYKGVDFAKLRQVKLTKNLSGYVSYRWGDKVYWTSYMLTLRTGETVFTDGVYLVRGRGLNCYSPQPMLPVRPDEPSEKALDTPLEMPVIKSEPNLQ